MPKRSGSFPLLLPAREPGTPAYRWLCAALRREILDGRLRPGARLPATRDLARQYGLSRGTIVTAFEQLRSEGYVSGSVGSGTYVNRTLPDELLQVARKSKTPPPRPLTRHRIVSAFAERVRPFPGVEFRRTRAFRTNQPALELFPTSLWAQITSRRMRNATASMLHGCDPMGYLPLREAVAEYLTTSRGVICVPEQVMIVSGVQESLDLTARLLLNPGDAVLVEDPGYVGASLVFGSLGAKIVAGRIDAEGLQLPSPRGKQARLAYMTPAHQSPLGVSMSLPRRLAFLEWARAANAVIFEDDYDSEYRYSGRPVPALQGLDRHGVVLFSGTFSKVLFPSLRLGYLILPLDLTDIYSAAKSVASRHASVLEQAVLCDFIVDGHFGRHVRRMREAYAERRLVLMESAAQHLKGLLEIPPTEAGLQTIGWLQRGIRAQSAAAAAASRNVEVLPVPRNGRWAAPVADALVLGFAAVDLREIRRGVRDLAIALQGEVGD